MRYLLDTHTLIWAALDSRELSNTVVSIFAEPAVAIYVSAASAWEMATKNRLGKLPGVEPFLEQFETRTQSSGYRLLDMSVRHSLLAGKLPAQHKDPFDRMIAAQALLEEFTLLSRDPAMDAFGVKRVW